MHFPRAVFPCALVTGLAAALLAPLVAAAAPAPAVSGGTNAPAPPLRVVQWNIGHFAMGKSSRPTVPPAESEARAAEYRAKIAELKADFLGVSEFDRAFDTSGSSSVEKIFASFPSHVAGPKKGYQCNAVFSRFPCVRRKVFPYAERWQGTYFLDSVYWIGGREVHFVQTHLDWNASEKAALARPKQIQQLIAHFADTPYVIIAGDFNVRKVEEYQPFVEAGWRIANCGPEAGCLDTVAHSRKAKSGRQYPLDNIIAKGFRLHGVFLEDKDLRLSDHRILGCVAEMVDGGR